MTKCKDHPDAPHGFCRDASHAMGRYVCECEYWEQQGEPMSLDYLAWKKKNPDKEYEDYLKEVYGR